MADIKIGDLTFPNDTTEILVPINGSTELQSFIIPSGNKTIVNNGTTDVREYDRVTVNVPLNSGDESGGGTTIEDGTMTVSAIKGTVSGNQVTVTPKAQVTKAGYFSTGTTNGTGVTVKASDLVSGTLTKTANGTYDVTNYATFVANIAGSSTPKYQAKTGITPTTSSQTITPDSSYDALSSVQINAIPSTYIIPSGDKSITSNGSKIDVKQFATVTVNVPSDGASGSINPAYTLTIDGSGSVAAPTITDPVLFIDSRVFTGVYPLSNASKNMIMFAVGTNGETVSYSSYSAAGAFSAGQYASYIKLENGNFVYSTSKFTAGQVFYGFKIGKDNSVNVGGGSSVTINVQSSKTVTLSTTPQDITPDSGYDAMAKVTVSIPNTYVKPTKTQVAKTWTPGTTNQTIDSGTYLSGTQTISGDTNLVASNIKNGVKIFNVTGTYTGSGGTSATVKSVTAKLSSSGTEISFTGLTGSPKSWSIVAETQLTVNTTNTGTRTVIGVHGDGTNVYGNCVQSTTSFYTTTTTSYTSTAYTTSYSNGTFTVTSGATTTGGQFYGNNSFTYRLIYTY